MNQTERESTPNFRQDMKFLSNHFDTVRLQSIDGDAQVVVVPALQGRVMTSSCQGLEGDSFGWINYDLVRKGILPENQRTGLEKQIHVFGGEERFWLGPEGGQFGLFFPKSAPDFEFQYWKTPEFIDTEPFQEVDLGRNFVSFQADGSLTNRMGTTFDLKVDRLIQVLRIDQVAELLNCPFVLNPEIKSVAFQSSNTVTNVGQQSWQRETGLPSIWMLGMLKPDPSVVMVVPLENTEQEPCYRDDYFLPPGNDRLLKDSSCLFFRGDGLYRSKIGIPAKNATEICGSYSLEKNALTILHYKKPIRKQTTGNSSPNQEPLPYVKSQWENHQLPYDGDVINCYNDGPPEPGAKPLGPFYELESSSPGLELASNDSFCHTQSTIHFQGSPEFLDPIAKSIFGVSIEKIQNVFSN